MTLIPTLKQRLASPSDLVDLADVSELTGIRVEKNDLVIGAMTTHAPVARSKDVHGRIPALAALDDGFGDDQVRNRATICGSIAHHHTAEDLAAARHSRGAPTRPNAIDSDPPTPY